MNETNDILKGEDYEVVRALKEAGREKESEAIRTLLECDGFKEDKLRGIGVVLFTFVKTKHNAIKCEGMRRALFTPGQVLTTHRNMTSHIEKWMMEAVKGAGLPPALAEVLR